MIVPPTATKISVKMTVEIIPRSKVASAPGECGVKAASQTIIDRSSSLESRRIDLGPPLPRWAEAPPRHGYKTSPGDAIPFFPKELPLLSTHSYDGYFSPQVRQPGNIRR